MDSKPTNLEPKKSGLKKTGTLKNRNPKNHGINMELKQMSDFTELNFTNTMRNLICLSLFSKLG